MHENEPLKEKIKAIENQNGENPASVKGLDNEAAPPEASPSYESPFSNSSMP